LFIGALPSVSSDLISRTIPCLVNDADNAALTQLPTFREVEQVVFNLPPTSAPGKLVASFIKPIGQLSLKICMVL